MSSASADMTGRPGDRAMSTSRSATAGVPNWLAILEDDGLVAGDVLRTAWTESKQDPRAVGAWLVEHGCVPQRELSLAQAESHGLAFIEPGELFGELAIFDPGEREECVETIEASHVTRQRKNFSTSTYSLALVPEPWSRTIR